MRPERMARVSILCKSVDTRSVIDALASLKAVHLVDHKDQSVGTVVIHAGVPAASAEELSATLNAARNLVSKVSFTKNNDVTQQPLNLSERIQRAKQLVRTFSVIEEEERNLQTQLQQKEQMLSLVDALPYDDPLETLFATKRTQTYVLKATKQSNQQQLAVLQPLLLRRLRNHVLIVVETGKDIKQDILRAQYTLVDLSLLRNVTGTKIVVHQQLSDDISKHRLELVQISSKRKCFDQDFSFLKETEEILTLEVLKAQVPMRFGSTKRVTFINGFIPLRNEQELRARLSSLALIDTTPTHDAPTLLHNNRVAKSFESIIEMYSLPKYDELDPTSVLTFTFPLFFGFMLGDIGYGIVALITFMIVRSVAPKLRSFANMLILSAIATIVFGFFFGEFFGLSTILGFHLSPILQRQENVITLLGIAAAIGVVHINLGLLLGMYNERHEGLFFAVVKKGSWMVLEVGALLLAAHAKILSSIPVLSHIHADAYSPWVLIALALIGIIYSEGPIHLVEVLGIFTNMMSYLRLAAVGLSSVYIAFIVNQLATGMFAQGGMMLLVGILILLIGHAFNLALGLLGPFIHSLRLHYVEFFTKFYEGGGEKYTPFGVIEVPDA